MDVTQMVFLDFLMKDSSNDLYSLWCPMVCTIISMDSIGADGRNGKECFTHVTLAEHGYQRIDIAIIVYVGCIMRLAHCHHIHRQ